MSDDHRVDPKNRHGDRAAPSVGERIRDVVEGAADWLGEQLVGILTPAPQPVPIPVRRPTQRR